MGNFFAKLWTWIAPYLLRFAKTQGAHLIDAIAADIERLVIAAEGLPAGTDKRKWVFDKAKALFPKYASMIINGAIELAVIVLTEEGKINK